MIRSLNRPEQGVDASVLTDHRKLVESIDRRRVLRGAVSLGALTLLTGCDVTNRDQVQDALRAVSRWNDRVQGWIFDPNRRAPSFDESQVLKPPRFNAFYPMDQVKPVDGAAWKLELTGLIRDRQPWTLERLNALQQVSQITRHVCVEGWDYIGKWSGVALRPFLESIGADRSARYVAFRCADGYTSSLDMATALHAQTQLALRYADEVLPAAFGFPIRLRSPMKLGFKLPKWIVAMEVTNVYYGGRWEDRGYNWFSGL